MHKFNGLIDFCGFWNNKRDWLNTSRVHHWNQGLTGLRDSALWVN